MKKHTLGEWVVRPGGTDTSLQIVAENCLNQELIAQVPTYGEGEANALLIASAPTLLQALRDIEETCEEGISSSTFSTIEHILGIVRFAIDRSEGRE